MLVDAGELPEGELTVARFVRDIYPTTLQALIYMWHPDALDAFDSHLGVLSNFSDTIVPVSNRGDDLWTTWITLSHWRLESRFESRIRETEVKTESKEQRISHLGSSKYKERNGSSESGIPITASTAQGEAAFPPKGVSDFRDHIKDSHKDRFSKIRGLAISLVMTGDCWGRYWTCTVMNELIDEKAAGCLTRETQDILQMFIHQQYTGRTLVFFLVLGYYCEYMADECENFTDQLDQIMGMDVSLDEIRYLRGVWI